MHKRKERDKLSYTYFEFACGDGCGLRRAADPAGHADIEHIVTRGERPLKVFLHPGHIVSCGKVRGLKRAYAELANYFDTRALDKSESIGIAHADNAEGAQALLALLREKGYQVQGAVILFSPAHEKGQGRAARGRQYRPHGRRPE